MEKIKLVYKIKINVLKCNQKESNQLFVFLWDLKTWYTKINSFKYYIV